MLEADLKIYFVDYESQSKWRKMKKDICFFNILELY